MNCIIKQDREQKIVGWIIATDMHDARRQASHTGENELAQFLYRAEFEPPPGQYPVPVGQFGEFSYVMLTG